MRQLTTIKAGIRLTLQLLVVFVLACCVAPVPENQFRELLQTLKDDYALPGITAAIVLADSTVITAASGFADLETEKAMTPQTRMLAASIGKTMVAATVMDLWDQGELDLDAPLSPWLDRYPWYTALANHASLTPRQLLGHRSGLADHVYTEEFATELGRRWREQGELFSPEDLLGFILDKPAQASAEAVFAYSDSGYILLGLLIEAVSGRSYYDTIQHRFIEPLGLTATSPSNQRLLPGLAAGYTTSDNPFGFPAKSLTDAGELAWHPGLEWTGGGLVTTSQDLARWGHALFSGEVLSPRALEQMLQTRPIDPAVPESRYGLGIAHFASESRADVFGHAGWIPAYVSSLRHYARYDITLAFQINSDIGLSGEHSGRLADIEIALLSGNYQLCDTDSMLIFTFWE